MASSVEGDAEEVDYAPPCWLQSPDQTFASLQGTVYMTASFLCYACFDERVRRILNDSVLEPLTTCVSGRLPLLRQCQAGSS